MVGKQTQFHTQKHDTFISVWHQNFSQNCTLLGMI